MKTGPRRSREAAVVAAALASSVIIFGCGLLGLSPAPILQPQTGAGSAAPCLPGIYPGKTTQNEVVASLGYPLATLQEEEGDIMQYASAVYGQLNSVMVRGGVVTLVSVVQPADPSLKWSDVKAGLGEPSFTAYTNYQQGSQVFAFPERGRAFTADAAMDAVFIQQCFAPMPLDQYQLAFGNAFPTEDPFTR